MHAQAVVISAGASGIGLATAERFRAAGARVAICDISQAALDRAMADDRGLVGRAVDVANEAEAASFIDEVESLFGGITTLVNNAGIAGAQAAIEQISAVDWQRSFEVNVQGAFHLTKAVIPHMKARGGGAIVNVSTGSVTTLPCRRSDYVASKWALEGFTRAAARELGPSGIRVNAVRPGYINSERMHSILGAKAVQEGKQLADLESEFLQFISMRTKIEPGEIGDMIMFLASPAALHVTGQIISVDGNIEWEK